MKPVVLAGHVCLDLSPRLPAAPSVEPGHLIEVGPIDVWAGGCVGNTGAALTGLGLPTRFAACVGADELGTALVSILRQMGADISEVRLRDDLATSYSIVIEAAGRDRTFWHHVGANAGFDGREVTVEDAGLLHVGYPTHLPALLTDDAGPLRALLGRARAAGVTTSIDLAELDPRSAAARLSWPGLLPELLPLVDVVSPSVDDLEAMLPGRHLDPREWAELLVSWGAGVAMVTAGQDGLWVRSGTRARLAGAGTTLAEIAEAWSEVDRGAPALPVPVVTTTGAGDAASAGLIYAIARGKGPAFGLALAAASAAARISATPYDRALAIARAADRDESATPPDA